MKRFSLIYSLLLLLLLLSTRQQRKKISHPSWVDTKNDYINAYSWNSNNHSFSKTTCFQWECFDIEIADTDLLRKQWLMHRTSLWYHSWMLFVFPKEGKYPFWMKNTLIPLDMIWISNSWFIVEIVENVPPCGLTWSMSNNCPSYGWTKFAKYVLELNSWAVKKYWIHIGDAQDNP